MGELTRLARICAVDLLNLPRNLAQGGASPMRDHNKAFCRLVAETFDCPSPVFEFGSYQVDGQEGYANLRQLFPAKSYVGCDMRSGPGVDRVEDVTDISLPDESAGTILCIETFEHVFDVSRAFDEVHRLLKPGGIFVITSPLNFRIHAYPDDYWRMTPSCLQRHLSRYAASVSGYQGDRSFPHTVMGVGIKAPAAFDCAVRLEQLVRGYKDWLERAEASLPLGEKIRRRASMIYRSKGERRQIAGYFKADFTIDSEPGAPRLGRERAAGAHALAAG
jgi:SAM-dependent methyltransferase